MQQNNNLPSQAQLEFSHTGQNNHPFSFSIGLDSWLMTRRLAEKVEGLMKRAGVQYEFVKRADLYRITAEGSEYVFFPKLAGMPNAQDEPRGE